MTRTLWHARSSIDQIFRISLCASDTKRLYEFFCFLAFLIGVTPMHTVWGIFDLMMQRMQLVMFTENLAMLGARPPPSSTRALDKKPPLRAARHNIRTGNYYAAVSAGTGGTNGSS